MRKPKVIISLRVDPNDVALLHAYSEKKGKTLSSIVRALLRRKVERIRAAA